MVSLAQRVCPCWYMVQKGMVLLSLAILHIHRPQARHQFATHTHQCIGMMYGYVIEMWVCDEDEFLW